MEKYKCPICQANFSQKWSRDRHLAGDKCRKPLQCDVCGKYFSRTQHLKRHQNTHTTAHVPNPVAGSSDNPHSPLSHSKKRKYVNVTYLTSGDTPEIPPFISDNEATIAVYKDHYSAIWTFKLTVSGKIRHVYNYRLETGDVHEISVDLTNIFKEMQYRFKVNCSFGCILENIETGRFRYWHSSQNDYLLFSEPQQIQNEDQYIVEEL